jgi:hypothetical protein
MCKEWIKVLPNLSCKWTDLWNYIFILDRITLSKKKWWFLCFLSNFLNYLKNTEHFLQERSMWKNVIYHFFFFLFSSFQCFLPSDWLIEFFNRDIKLKLLILDSRELLMCIYLFLFKFRSSYLFWQKKRPALYTLVVIVFFALATLMNSNCR